MKRKLYSFSGISLLLISIFLLSFKAHSQTYQWRSLSMGAGGFVSGLITSKQEQNLMYCRTDVGGAYKWNATTSTWTPLLDWASATQSGFYGVESLAIDPRATNKVYMLVGISYFDNGKTAILKSDDYGQTFTTIDVSSQFKAHGNGMGRSNGERLQVDPNLGSVLYVGTRYNGLWKSTNSGLTWSRLNGLNINTTPNGAGISFVLIDSASSVAGVATPTLYVGVSQFGSVGDNLYKSTDGGTTFNPVTGGPSAFMPQKAVLNANGNLIINYANGSGPFGTTIGTSVENMDNGAIYKYAPSTSTWTNITPSGISRAWGGISVDPRDPNRMIASTINNYQLQYGPSSGGAYGDRIYLTTNGGASWTDVVSRGFTLNTNGINWINGQAIHWAGSVEFDPFNTAKVFITSGNGVFSNNNIDVASTQWKFEVNGLEETVPTDIASSTGAPLFTTIGDYDGFRFTNLNQYGERFTPAMGTTSGLAYGGLNNDTMVRVGSKMYYSFNQGASWTQTAVINGTNGRVALSADGNTILHTPNGSGTTYYSTNFGASWTASTINVSNSIPVADMVNSSKFYIYNSGSGNVNVSTNGGAAFSVTVNIGTNGSKLIRTVPGMEGHIWVAMYGGGLKRSINSGTSFTTIANVQACSAVGLGKAAAGASYFTLYMWGTVNGVTGLFRSIDEGANWVRLNDDTHQFGGPGNAQFVVGDMNTFGTVYMSTVGRGVIVGQDLSVLPIAIASFNVHETELNNMHAAQISWTTASENNTGYFVVERSINGTSWTSVSSVYTKAVNGNSSSPLNYVYNDDLQTLSGTVYYRIKTVDKEGRFTYGSVLSINIGKINKGFMVSISPNPVERRLGANVRVTSDKSQNVSFRVVSSNGAVMFTKQTSISTGNTSVALSELKNKPAGVYTLQVLSSETNQQLQVVRFVLQ